MREKEQRIQVRHQLVEMRFAPHPSATCTISGAKSAREAPGAWYRVGHSARQGPGASRKLAWLEKSLQRDLPRVPLLGRGGRFWKLRVSSATTRAPLGDSKHSVAPSSSVEGSSTTFGQRRSILETSSF